MSGVLAGKVDADSEDLSASFMGKEASCELADVDGKGSSASIVWEDVGRRDLFAVSEEGVSRIAEEMDGAEVIVEGVSRGGVDIEVVEIRLRDLKGGFRVAGRS